VQDDARVDKTSANGAVIGARANVGPFAALGHGERIEPDTVTGPLFLGGQNDPG
jgi:bifunctional N-acetylglucosamine-1-phosphate-uridyltransferase/glucosamine-1-phosphate-acetyltransferase GlmU-like protein